MVASSSAASATRFGCIVRCPARIGAGSFSQDTRGRWYINCPVEVSEGICLPGSRRWTRRVGIDLGLKDLVTLSTGEKVEVPKFYRRSEERVATVQRARKTRRARAIHAKIANRRKDFLHRRAPNSPMNTGSSSSEM